MGWWTQIGRAGKPFADWLIRSSERSNQIQKQKGRGESKRDRASLNLDPLTDNYLPMKTPAGEAAARQHPPVANQGKPETRAKWCKNGNISGLMPAPRQNTFAPKKAGITTPQRDGAAWGKREGFPVAKAESNSLTGYY